MSDRKNGAGRFPFRFEKTRLLSQSTREELWKGTVDGNTYLLRRLGRVPDEQMGPSLFACRIHHPLLLPPNGVEMTGNRTIHYLFQCGSISTRIPKGFSLKTFVANLISLAFALQKHHYGLRWNQKHLMYREDLKQLSLVTLDLVLSRDPGEMQKMEYKFLADLSRWLKKRGENKLSQLLRPTGSRKSNHMQRLLQQFLSDRTCLPEGCWLKIEHPRAKELELVAGLYRLAEHARGRAILFTSDPGEGGSNLLLQIQRTLTQRGAFVSLFRAVKDENRPLHAARRLLDQLCEETGAYQRFRKELPIFRAMDGTGEWSEEMLIHTFLKLLSKRGAKQFAHVLLLDDVHLFDIPSLHMLDRLSRQIQELPVLFVLTSRTDVPELQGGVTKLALNPIAFAAYSQAYCAPFWKDSQRNSYLRQFYNRTSGNFQMFHEYFLETFRRRFGTAIWSEGEWRFREGQIPSFPDALTDFYLRQIPDLTDSEAEFLNFASAQGEIFDPQLVNAEKQILDSLILKGVLSRSGDRVRFQPSLLREALYTSLEPERRKEYHRRIAEIRSQQMSPGGGFEIARHFLKAERYPDALSEALRATAQMAPGSAPEAVALFEELREAKDLNKRDQITVLQQLANLLFHSNKYPAAISALRDALRLQSGDRKLRFELSLCLAECLLMDQDMRSAQEILQEQSRYLPRVTDQNQRFRFHFARGICSSHRGGPAQEDLEQAFEIAESRQDYFSLAHGYRRYAEIVLQNGQLKKALQFARKAFRFARKLQNLDEIGHVYRVLASLSWHQSRYRKAERLLKRSNRLFQKTHNAHGLARNYSLLGNIRKEQYRHSEGIEAFQKACSLFARLENSLDVSLAQFNLGLLYVEQGKLEEAERIFLRCREKDRKSGFKRYYAFDLRALAAIGLLRGHYRKTGKLLKRSFEIFGELHAKSDMLQTELYLLMNEMEQKNYRQAALIVDSLRKQLPAQTDPFTRSDIHYLLGLYCVLTGDRQKAKEHITKSLNLARKSRYRKQLAKGLILRLVLEDSTPSGKSRELTLAEKYHRQIQSTPDFAEDFLLLYQTYPDLLQHRTHSNRLVQLERIYRSFRNHVKHRVVRELSQSKGKQELAIEPMYDWWKQILEILRSEKSLEAQLQGVLKELSAEFRASYSFIQYISEHGTIEREVFPNDPPASVEDDLFSLVSTRMAQLSDGVCMDIRTDPEFVSSSWKIVHNVVSVLAIPVRKDDQLSIIWYFERRGQEPVFTSRDLQKAQFFSSAVMPALESAFDNEFRKRRQPYDSIRAPYPDLLGRSPAIQQVFRQMERISSTDVSVLILGESGTGKELVARNLHRNSNRSSGPFQVINCGSIPETLVESELFGHNKGAFTGAISSRQGYVERAASGTLFMDEIGELSLSAQSKLLRVLQEKEIQRLGDTITRHVDVRFVFATHQDLKKMVERGSFREDLYYRVAVAIIEVPPLRDRPEDIPLLTEHFLNAYRSAFEKGNVRIAPAAMRCLREYSWPGNVRELENVVQSILIHCDSSGSIDAGDLPSSITENRFLRKLSGTGLEEARKEFERAFLQQTLDRNRWNKTQTARELKITRQGLIHMIHRLGLEQSAKRK